jgi:hypothetical protein
MLLDKAAYKLATIQKEPGKRSGLLKYHTNWSCLRKRVPRGVDEFYKSPAGNVELLEEV